MKNRTLLSLISISTLAFSVHVFAAEDAALSQLIFFNPKKAALNYEIKKTADKPEAYTLTLKEDKMPDVTASLRANDAKLLLSEMTTTVWDYQYKLKTGKPGCPAYATLRVKENVTTVCREEKEKSAKMLGLMSRLNYLLKQK